jgi:hypothetical protein
MSATIAFELLDSGQGYVIQSWEFGDDSLIHIGRSKDCDIVIANQYVSRSHAYFHRVGSECLIACVSQAGVFLNGERIEQLPLTDGVVFRLAHKGPMLRFRSLVCPPPGDNHSTLQFDPDRVLILNLQEGERDAEVQEIVGSPYFQELQRKARLLRAKPGG